MTMRPRISRLEAQFLLETLQIRKEEIQALVERREQLDCEMYQLRKEVKFNPYVLIDKDKRFKDKKEELQRLEALSYKLFALVGCYDSLIAKFSRIANGEKHVGRYKSRETFYQWRLRDLVQIEPKTA